MRESMYPGFIVHERDSRCPDARSLSAVHSSELQMRLRHPDVA